jgi:hypothetical protein
VKILGGYMADDFNAAMELAKIHEIRKALRRRCTWGKSRLTKYRAELIKLKEGGASYVDLAYWLRINKRVKIDSSNIQRFLKKNFSVSDQNG